MSKEQAVVRQDRKRIVPRWFSVAERVATVVGGFLSMYVFYLFMLELPISDGLWVSIAGCSAFVFAGLAPEQWRAGKWITAASLCLWATLLLCFVAAFLLKTQFLGWFR